MRVLIYGFSGKILGGIETFILNMNDHMSSDTIFDYIIDGAQCVYRDHIEKRGGQILYVPGVRKNPFAYIHSFWSALGEQHKAGTNLFYVQLFSMANMLPVLLAKMRGYKVILHAHNNGLQSKSKVYKLIHLLGKFITKNGDYIRFTNSQLSSDFMFGKGVKSELIYNAIDTGKFAFRQEWRDEIRNGQSVGDKTVVGFVGRFSPQKNPIFMLEVFAEYHKIVPNSELWIVGEGEMKSDMDSVIEQLHISDSIKWLGRRNDVHKIMSGMDLLLQPSLFEGLGIVLIEAQSTGLPCVASAVVIPAEAKATGIIHLIDLDKGSIEWARECSKIESPSNSERMNMVKVFPDNFKIEVEARRLEQLLLQYNLE